MHRKFQVGCPCCDPCNIDAFTAELEIEDANETTIRPAEHPQSPYPTWLQAEAKVENGAIAKLCFLWDDSSPGDGLYLEFIPDDPTATSGQISVYTKADSKIAGPWYITGAVSSVWHTITICYDPDTDPNEMVITFDPDGETYPTQSFNVMLPTGMTVGRKAGHGTGNGTGSVWFRNYKFDRMWYCGTSPYTSDCHELMDDWDYYYDLPQRTECHECTRCPAGPNATSSGAWRQLSETWSFSLSGATATPGAMAISYAGQSSFEVAATANARTYIANDKAIVGMSDILGENRVYIVVSTSAATGDTIPVGTYYDEEYDRFYWWFVSVGSESITYSIYRVTNGGSPSLEVGPTTVAPSGSVALADGYVTLHAPMRNWLIGADSGNTSNVLHGGTRNQCTCGGGTDGYEESPKPRKYSAAVAGIVAGSTPVYSGGLGTIYADVTRLNRSATLRNYFHLTPGSPYKAPCSNCCHSDWVIDSGSQLTWFRARRETDTTELLGYAYMTQSTPAGAVTFEVVFKKTIYGKVELRDLSGEVLTYDSMTPATGGYIDASSATFTVTSVV